MIRVFRATRKGGDKRLVASTRGGPAGTRRSTLTGAIYCQEKLSTASIV